MQKKAGGCGTGKETGKQQQAGKGTPSNAQQSGKGGSCAPAPSNSQSKDEEYAVLFNKPVSISTQTRLQNSACRRFKDQVLKNFPALAEHEVDAVLPKKAPIFQVFLHRFTMFRFPYGV